LRTVLQMGQRLVWSMAREKQPRQKLCLEGGQRGRQGTRVTNLAVLQSGMHRRGCEPEDVAASQLATLGVHTHGGATSSTTCLTAFTPLTRRAW
jgi:hypothetical protein